MTILFFAKKSRPRMRSVCRFGQMMALTMQDFQAASCNCRCILQYSSKVVIVAESFFLSMKVPDTESGLKSLCQGRHITSAKLEEISTGVDSWSMRARIRVGAQVAGAPMQHVHQRWFGRERL